MSIYIAGISQYAGVGTIMHDSQSTAPKQQNTEDHPVRIW